MKNAYFTHIGEFINPTLPLPQIVFLFIFETNVFFFFSCNATFIFSIEKAIEFDYG